MDFFASRRVFFDQRRLCCTPLPVRFQQLGNGSHKGGGGGGVCGQTYVIYTTIYMNIHISPWYPFDLSSAAGVMGSI
jgi:hypothetical protein